jgi:two-component system response regulator LytT
VVYPKVTAPVIFCTAYDQYAIEAFKANGVAYILKPFSKDSLAAAFEKVTLLKSHYSDQGHIMDQLAGLLNQRQEFQGKQSFLVIRHHKYLTIPTENIAFFYVRNESATIMASDGQEYALAQSLDEIAASLNPLQFFRVNRQYLISFKAIVEVEHYFARKLLVKMTPATSEPLLVGKDKATAFLNWLEKR